MHLCFSPFSGTILCRTIIICVEQKLHFFLLVYEVYVYAVVYLQWMFEVLKNMKYIYDRHECAAVMHDITCSLKILHVFSLAVYMKIKARECASCDMHELLIAILFGCIMNYRLNDIWDHDHESEQIDYTMSCIGYINHKGLVFVIVIGAMYIYI